jgi:hypothetical protein
MSVKLVTRGAGAAPTERAREQDGEHDARDGQSETVAMQDHDLLLGAVGRLGSPPAGRRRHGSKVTVAVRTIGPRYG